MQFVGSPLQGREIVAQGARNRVFKRSFERLLTFCQGGGYLLAIMETGGGGVN